MSGQFTSRRTSPAKRPVSLDSDDFQPEQKLRRSAKTLVRSKAKAAAAAETEAVDLTETTPARTASAKQASPPRTPAPKKAAAPKKDPVPPKAVSPAKAASPAKTVPPALPSPVRAPTKRAVAIQDDEADFVTADEAPPTPAADAEAKKFKYAGLLPVCC